jgi:hypothetical protein
MAGDDYNFLLNNKPQDFRFKPACGKVFEGGSVTVSGFNTTEKDVDEYGMAYSDLLEIFETIDKKAEEIRQANAKKKN